MSVSPVIHDSLKELTIKALGEIRSTNEMPFKTVPQISMSDPKWSSQFDKSEPVYWPIISGIIKKNEATPVFETFQRSLESDSVTGSQINTLVGTCQTLRRVEAKDILDMMLTQQIEKNGLQIPFDEELFETSFQQLVEFFSSPNLKIKFTAILENFEMDFDSIELEPDLSIHRLSRPEIEQMWNKYSWFREYYPFPLAGRSLFTAKIGGLVETYVETPKIVGENKRPDDFFDFPVEMAAKKFHLVLTAFRLLKPGTVKLGIVITYTPFLSGESTSTHSMSYGPGNIFGPKYWLDETEVSGLESNWNMLKKIDLKQNGHLNVGLRRFNLANERSSYEDILIDTNMAFESFVLRDMGDPQERGELRHRLSVRVAHLLGQNSDDMLEIYKTMKKIYDLRSLVVHGDMLKSDDFGYVEKAIDLCRRTAQNLFMLESAGKKPKWDEWLFK